MHLMRLWLLLLAVNFMTVAWAEPTARLKGPKEFDTPVVTRLGPLSAQDTLWRLAEQARPDKRINMYQMMYALYQKNPDAFLDDNFNHLRTGAFLDVPATREILVIDPAMAQRKSENDDRLWAERIRKVAAQKPEEKSARATDVQKAKEEITEELFRVESEQKEQLADLRERMAASVNNVESIVKENTQLRQQLDTVVNELGGVKKQLDKDSEIQTQLQQLLSQQNEMLEQQREQIRKQQEGFNFAEFWQNIANSQAGWVLAAALPAALILMTFVMFIRRKGQRAAAAVSAATASPTVDPNYKSPLPPLDDSLDFDESSLINLDDSLLSDSLDSGIRLDEPEPVRSKASFSDDDLLDDHIDLSAPSPAGKGAFDLDDLLDEPLDDLLDPPTAAPTSANSFDPDNILGGDALDQLLAEEDAQFVAKDDFDPNNILSGNELSSLFANLTDDDADELAPTNNEQQVSADTLANAAAEAAASDELLEEIELDLPGDEPTPMELGADDDFDIDALVAQTQANTADKSTEPESAAVASGIEDDEDEFDIDAILAMSQQDSAASQRSNEPAQPSDHSSDTDLLDQPASANADALAQAMPNDDAFDEMPRKESMVAADSHEIEAFAESLVDEFVAADDESDALTASAPIDAVDDMLDAAVEPVSSSATDDFIPEQASKDGSASLDSMSELAEFAEMLADETRQAELESDAVTTSAAMSSSNEELTEFDLSDMDLESDVDPQLQVDSTSAHLPNDNETALVDSGLHIEAQPGQPTEASQSATALEVDDLEEITDADLLDELDEILNEVAEIRAQSNNSDLKQLQLPEEAIAGANEDFADAELTPADVGQLLTEPDEFAVSDESPAVDDIEAIELGDDDLLDGVAAGLQIETDLAAEAQAESEYLTDFADLDEMPDLQQGDDQSVSRVSDAAMSVEKPSRVLDEYPELALDDADLSEIYPEESNVPVDLSDEPVDEMGALDHVNFDELLAELDAIPAQDEPFVDEDASEVAADADLQIPAHDLPDYVHIDKLLAATEDQLSTSTEPTRLNMDVGLSDFEAMIAADEMPDAEHADAGFAGQLDLVRAYIEIGDEDSAKHLIKELLSSDAPQHIKNEASALLS